MSGAGNESDAGRNRSLARDVALCLLLVLAVGLVYGQTAGHGFLTWDDPRYVTENPPVLKGLTLEGLRWAFFSWHASNWHPLTWLSHMADVEMWGLKPAGHHLMSVLIHALSTLALFWAFRLMTGAPWASALVAALFALHPMHVESVAWVSERKDTLSMFFGILAILCHAWFAKKPGMGRYLLVYAALLCSLMAKQMMVTLPFVLLLLDYWPLQRFPAPGTGKEEWRRAAGALVFEKIPLFLLVALAAGLALYTQSAGGSASPLDETSGLPLGFRLQNALVAWALYAKKFVWPFPMSAIYPLYGYPALSAVIFAGVFLSTLTALVVLARKTRPAVFTGWLWFLVTLLPVIGIIQLGWQQIADRYTYFPYIGLSLALVFGLAPLADRARLRPFFAVAGAALVLACGVSAWRQAALWKDTGVLFSRSVQVDPKNYIAYHNLAEYWKTQKNMAKAENNYQRALAANPGYYKGHNDYGAFLTSRGKPSAALDHVARALRINPDFVNAWVNLGNALVLMGETEKAVSAYKEALKINPGHASALGNLGKVALEKGKAGEAMDYYSRAVRANPYSAAAWAGLGAALLRQGEPDKALNALAKAVDLNPLSADSFADIGKALEAKGDPVKAREAYLAALLRDPANDPARTALAAREKNPEVLGALIAAAREKVEKFPDKALYRYSLAGLLNKAGDTQAAIGLYMGATALDPGLFAAHNDLAVALLAAGKPLEAKRAAEKALALSPQSIEAHYNMACALAKSGDAEGALGWLKKTVALGFRDADQLARDPDLEAVRSLGGYQTLIASMGTPPGGANNHSGAVSGPPSP
jgi:tetratricopeptide (TPR) repeat protein